MRFVILWLAVAVVACSEARGQVYRADPLIPPGGFVPFEIDPASGLAAGRIPVGQTEHAAVWDMNGGTITDLQPAGYGLSIANGVGGGQQVGYAFSKDGQTQRAMLWRGTAASGLRASSYA